MRPSGTIVPRQHRPALSMHIEKRGSRYEALVRSEWGLRWRQVELPISENDLRTVNHLLQVAMQDVADHGDPHEAGRSLRKGTGPLAELARRGQVAFDMLFPEGRPARRLITSSLHCGALIEIASDEFLLPWELLYFSDRPRYSVSCFWGMRFNIARMAVTRSANDDTGWSSPGEARPMITTSRPRVGLIVSEDLPFVRNVEIPAFKRLRDRAVIWLECLDPLDNQNRRASLVLLREFMGDELDLLHLACHAEADDREPEMLLEVSDAFPITFVDFHAERCSIPSGAFVVLNACRTGTMVPGSVFGWASSFLQKGARGVLATEFQVPDDFAPQFASRFYDHFLGGVSVGEAVLRTRRDCWRLMRNPLGLGYSLYSSPDVRIVSPEVS